MSFGYQVLGFGSGGAAPSTYVVASGGTITTVDTNYKVHTFTGPGTFCVSTAGCGSDTGVDYLVIAGGGAAGPSYGGGGGAGGYRESNPGAWTGAPIAASGGAIAVSATGYPITVGGAGANSVFSSITSAAGGNGGTECPFPGVAGGSGGGAGYVGVGGAGNTPPVSPA